MSGARFVTCAATMRAQRRVPPSIALAIGRRRQRHDLAGGQRLADRFETPHFGEAFAGASIADARPRRSHQRRAGGAPAAASTSASRGNATLQHYAAGTWASFVAMTYRRSGLGADSLGTDGSRSVQTSTTNIAAYMWSALVAEDLGIGIANASFPSGSTSVPTGPSRRPAPSLSKKPCRPDPPTPTSARPSSTAPIRTPACASPPVGAEAPSRI